MWKDERDVKLVSFQGDQECFKVSRIHVRCSSYLIIWDPIRAS